MRCVARGAKTRIAHLAETEGPPRFGALRPGPHERRVDHELHEVAADAGDDDDAGLFVEGGLSFVHVICFYL
jgi:hypothetical protein